MSETENCMAAPAVKSNIMPSIVEVREQIAELQSELDRDITAIREKTTEECKASDLVFDEAKKEAKKEVRRKGTVAVAERRKVHKLASKKWTQLLESLLADMNPVDAAPTPETAPEPTAEAPSEPQVVNEAAPEPASVG